MAERFAVTAATGALGPVLVKLAALLGDEYKLQEGTRRGIESIKSELEPVHHLLGKLWGTEDLDWMAEARELSYDMEDGIDLFTLGLEHGDGGFVQREITDDGPLKEFMERVKDVSTRCGEMQKIGDAIICKRSKLSTDPRAVFLHKDASELVGMEEKKEDVIELLKKHEMVCILGPGGIGKTTLADLVYQTIGDEFQCRAFVSMHPSPNMTEILGTILSQVTDGAMSISLSEKSGTEPAAEKIDFSKGIPNFLSDKRYLVIIDDIWDWEEWEVIRKVLPENNLGCKLIMTTRVRSIAEKKCETEKGARVYELYFGRADAARLTDMRLSKYDCKYGLSTKITGMIANMCGGAPFYFCPLAVICLSSAWAESHHDAEWDTWAIHGEFDTWASHILDDGFLSTPSLKPWVQSLCLGFDVLPVQLRTCLLYSTIYPPSDGVRISRECLVRKWVAEGFVSKVKRAEAYFDELVSRNLLKREGVMHAVDPVMGAFLVCKAKEDNFIAYDWAGNSSHAKQIRRLSLSTDSCPDEDVLSHTRSLVVSGYESQLDGVPFNAFKKLRVLEIRNSSRLENGHLVDICGLIWIKCLVLMDCHRITELPREIGRLQNLETLYVAGTDISKLPTEIGKLQHLETLDVSGTKVTELPTWIEKLQSLKTLDVSDTKVTELPREIMNLKRLETLDISGTKVRELPWNPLLSVVVDTDIRRFSVQVEKLMLSLGVITSSDGEEDIISSSDQAKCRDDLSILILFNHFGERCEVVPVPMLRVAGRHMKVPDWVKKDLCNVCSLDIRLCKLMHEDLEFLKTQMYNLQALELRLEVLPREPIAITGGGFLKLETFYVDCRLPRMITFGEGAMPELKHLEFKFYTGTTSRDYYMGIKHLKSLEKVVFRCSKYYTSDGPGIREIIDVLRKEAVGHTNEITLWVNDMWPEVFGTGAKWISLADKAIVEKREKQFWAARERWNDGNELSFSGTSTVEEGEFAPY